MLAFSHRKGENLSVSVVLISRFEEIVAQYGHEIEQ